MKIYLVGGAIRDELLGYPYSERDWVVTGASPKILEESGFKNVGKDFPVFLHPDTREEYALARTERKTKAGYTGFEFDTSNSVTLEQDLLRRDLTINAIARDENDQLIDPYGGERDLNNRVLRHVSDSFPEDPVRLLRIARFAARYHHLGFTIASETLNLLKLMVDNGEVDSLVPERSWKEFEKALLEKNPEIFIQVLRECGALKKILPEINALFGVPQVSKYHPEIDTGLHTLKSLIQITKLSASSSTRFACTTHDLGKALTNKRDWPKHHGHEKLGLPALAQLCARLKVPKEHAELAKLAVEFHTHCHRAFELNPATILKLFKRADAYRKPHRFQEFLLCCKADAQGRTGFENARYPQANYLNHALSITRKVDAKSYAEQGLEGKEIGAAIEKARLDELESFVKASKRSLKFHTT